MVVLRVRIAVVALVVVVAGACAASIDVTVAGGPDTPDSAVPAEDPGLRATPAESTPLPAPSPTPAPVPELPYDEAIDVYFDDVERFWTAALPQLSGQAFSPIVSRVPYDPGDEASVPPCGDETGPIAVYADNAFYCEPDDYIAWDDVGLFPELYREYGDFTVGLVIAHEYSHAVQARAGLDGLTILVELQADCFAGAWAASVARGDADDIPFERADLDNAIGGFLTFADPLGTPARDLGAHGTAFDRVNAFAEGFEGGLGACPSFLEDPPQTASIFVDGFDANAGNFPLDGLLPLLMADLGLFLETLAASQVDSSFVAPGAVVEFGGRLGDPPACGVLTPTASEVVGSAYFCAEDATVYIDRAELDELWLEVGDFAPAYSVAHSYAMSFVVELIGTDASAAVLAADCLVGVWARDVFDETRERPLEPTHEIALSAGDLDEGIVGLLLVPPLGPSLADPTGLVTFDRVAAFGQGFFRGVSQCEF